MEQLQAPPVSDLGQEPATGGFGAGAGPAPTTPEPEPVPGANPRSAGSCGAAAEVEGRTVSKSREPRAESREPRAESREPRAESREPRAESREPSSCPSPGRAVPRLNSGSRRRPPESSPAAPSRRGFPRHVFPLRRLAALAGGFRRSLPAAVLLALAALVPVLPGSSAVAQEVVEVPRNSPLKPSGLSATQKEFRLLFVTSAERNATSSNIADYNSFVQGRAAAGHSSIRPFASQFRVVGSTNSVDARDNTSTTYTSSNKGVPIYWLRGNKAADTYEDFYDGSWDERRNVRNEHGNAHNSGLVGIGPVSSAHIWTGSNNDGTKHSSQYLGENPVRFGQLGGSQANNRSPLSQGAESPSQQSHLYALSPVFTVVDRVDVTGVSMQSSPASGDTYAAEETITVRLTFTEAVNVTGRPFVYLNVGGALGKAVYAAGSGSANLDFAYTVAYEDHDGQQKVVGQQQIEAFNEPVVILGDPGFGKSVLTQSLGELPNMESRISQVNFCVGSFEC